ncbi:MAG: 16S rRNA (guanine(527)-N(7))-methyltransferase RsmG [Clostridia bacterium]
MDFNSFSEEMKANLGALSLDLSDEQIRNFFDFMNLLIEKNKVMNLTGIMEPKEVILKHFIDSLTILKYINENDSVIDVGTGAGFPGIPLKIAKKSLEITLLDSLNKRINFLNEVIENIKLDKTKTIHGRAEDFGQNAEYREKYDVAVSRAVAPLNILLEYMLPFIKVGGKCICMKGSNCDEEIENAKKAIEILGGKIEKIEKFNLPNSDNNRTILVIKKLKKTGRQYPRKAGIPTKKSL